jgi:chlorobactene glucosyltransferase
MLAPLLWTLPWVIPPIAVLWRARKSRSLDDVPAETGATAPTVSVIIPARNEQRNIERCARSVLASAYPSVELIVVDDHSTDGTGDIARSIARDDPRLRVIAAPELEPGWFGKQWACAAGARAAVGALLLFIDADTHHSRDLIPRAVNALAERRADLLTLAGHQEMHSFWERVIQPQVFAVLLMRYGSTEHVSRARRPADAIANGQFILVRRDAYDAMGGHERVRDRVAEDLSMAQEYVRAGRRIAMLTAMRQLSTHMYASLGELVGGWRKNAYAGGRHAALGGWVGRVAYPFLLLGLPVTQLVPVVALLLAVIGVLSPAWLVWSAIVVAVALTFWGVIYSAMGEPMGYALLYPLGLVALLCIAASSVARGNRVEWKERRYVAK